MKEPKFDFMKFSTIMEMVLGGFLSLLPLLYFGRQFFNEITSDWPASRLPLLVVLLFLPACLVVGLLLVLVRWAFISRRDARRGYSIRLINSYAPEGGTVKYEEGENRIELYFDWEQFTIYVPSDEAWMRDMPDWAKPRKTEIMDRIRREHTKAHFDETGVADAIASLNSVPLLE